MYLLNKNKNKFKKKKKKNAIIDGENSKEEISNDIIFIIKININENIESSFLNNQKDPSIISIDIEKKNSQFLIIYEFGRN